MIQKMKKSKGFTLIEMLVVIAIIAVLVSIIIPVVGNSTVKAKAATDAANLRSLQAELTAGYLTGSPTAATGDGASGKEIKTTNATIKIGTDNTVTVSFENTAPKCKSDSSATLAASYTEKDGFVCQFGKYTISDFSKVAGGEASALTGTGTEITGGGNNSQPDGDDEDGE